MPRSIKSAPGAAELSGRSPRPLTIGSVDLVAGVGLLVMGASAALLLPTEQPLRLALTLPAVLLVPGYLLMQALPLRRGSSHPRLFDVAYGLGITVPLLGLVGLAMALFPGGFSLIGFVIGLFVVCLGLSALAFRRRAQDRFAVA